MTVFHGTCVRGDHTVALGPFVKCPHAEMIEAIAHAGFDLAVVDMEHTPTTPRDLYPLVLAAERHGLQLVVRVPANEEPWIKWVLDLGVRFVQVPHVSTAAQAEHAVRLARFHPDGERGLCRFVRAADFSALPKARYLERAGERTRVVLQVEGAEGVANIEQIAAVPGVDMIFVGPYDLSQSLGRPGDIWHPDVVAGVERVVAVCAAHGVAVGTFTDTPEGVAHWAARGVEMIEYASDLALFLGGARALLA